jgi:hypothetical protein
MPVITPLMRKTDGVAGEDFLAHQFVSVLRPYLAALSSRRLATPIAAPTSVLAIETNGPTGQWTKSSSKRLQLENEFNVSLSRAPAELEAERLKRTFVTSAEDITKGNMANMVTLDARDTFGGFDKTTKQELLRNVVTLKFQPRENSTRTRPSRWTIRHHA